MPIFESIHQDLRYGTRMLLRNPGSTAVALFALSLGIAVNTAVITAYEAMVARPLQGRESGRLVNIALTRDSAATAFTFSYPDYEEYRGSLHSFSGLIAFESTRVTLSNAGDTVSQRSGTAGSALGRLGLLRAGAGNKEFASVFVVSENYFATLGVQTIQGRSFESMSASELGERPSVLISENYWQQRFAGVPGILGRVVYLNGVPVTIVGITPHDFVGTGVSAPAFWVPASVEPLLHGDSHWLRDREARRYRLFGRLANGAGIAQAQVEMTALMGALRTLQDPKSDSAKPAAALIWPGSPFPLPLSQYGGLTLVILLIVAASGMVLAVACANVGSLQLARARSRENELRTRISLGAGTVRVVRQLVTESALLGLAAGALGLLLSWTFLRIAVIAAANALPVEFGSLVFNVTPDVRIFGLVSAVSLLAGILSGMAPALQTSRSVLASSQRGSTSSRSSRRLQNVLVAAQVALSLVLMAAGSMAIRSSINALTLDTGYESRHTFAVNLQFPELSQYTAEHKLALTKELRARVSDLPGVTAVTSAPLPAAGGFPTAASPDGAPAPGGAQPVVFYSYIQGNYFNTLGIPIALGRSFQSHEGQYSVVVSESAARRLWPGGNPVGRTLRLGPVDERSHTRSELIAAGPIYQVVGVAGDTRGAQFDGSDARHIYLPMPDERLANYPILVRTSASPAPAERAVETIVLSIDSEWTAVISTLEELLRQAPPFIVSILAAAVACTIGLLGLLLALMGIYGTVSYIVVLRTREVGIRLAIGAQKHHVLGLVLRQSTGPVVAGLIAGMLLAIGASVLARGLLYGISGVDAVPVVGIALGFLCIALLASYGPARRVLRIDPVVALRQE
jgi:putative ABC transport system permease protein